MVRDCNILTIPVFATRNTRIGQWLGIATY
jgi:hypothetical protein